MYAFVFDFDGPIFDGRKAALSALEKTIEFFSKRYGKPDTSFKDLPLLRPPNMIAAIFKDQLTTMEELTEVEVYFRSELAKAEKIIPIDTHILEVFRILHQKNIDIGILSSRRENDLKEKLDNLGLTRFIQYQVGRDSEHGPKSANALHHITNHFGVAPESLIVIGDSDADWRCANEIGARYYHAAWSGEPCSFAYKHADALLHSTEALEEIIRGVRFVVPTLSADSVPAELQEAICDGALCFYAGAGVSVPSGIGDWQGHYVSIFKQLGVSFLLDEDLQLPEIVQLISTDEVLRKKMFDLFKQSFDQPHIQANGYHYAMLRGHGNRIWTTNYDDLFEKANIFGEFGQTVIKDDSTLLENFRDNRTVIKMNGDFFFSQVSG